MPTHYFHPQPPLADFVGTFWLHEGDPPQHTLERHLPDGTMQLILNLRDDTFRLFDRHCPDALTTVRGPLITGPRDTYTLLDTTCQATLLGVQFRPGGAFPLLGLPASELRNMDIPLDALWGAAAYDLRDRVLAAPTGEARVRALEQTLTARLAGREAPHPAVAFALREFHALPYRGTVAEVTDRIGLSPRRFIQVFSQAVGLPPKTYCRVRRFHSALRALSHGERATWAEIAVSRGYYDQAHFIHDFRAFSGLTPSAYLARRGAHPNHVPIGQQ
jgi:AraC-like DNA-binding protein